MTNDFRLNREVVFFFKVQFISSKCIWYEGIRDGFNRVYPDGQPKPMPLEDIPLLNEMCPNFPTHEGLIKSIGKRSLIENDFLGVSPNLCCDRKQLLEMQKFKYILDNLIGRCPSCYFNFLRIFCEMSCNPTHDEFIWPLEYEDIVRPSEQVPSVDDPQDENIKSEWALPDYVDPDDEEAGDDDSQEKAISKVVTKPVEKVRVITKIRYFISEEQANAFIASCW